ncbi:histidine phosphatase family protein [Gephyromycinifex aptenodytis]|uniref:histidine phosphatase family protein n=1 Tax=Gephyromycinifex aptenodytis TaxID=2716227 RepID=UPI0014452282|nr:histidine phosphatase family protein [Gephyromycinifex aptenodytis]
MRLLLVRHGQTTSNVGHKLDTAEPGADLTELGRQQAQAIPAALAEENVHSVYVSNLVRTQQTAAPLLEHLGMQAQVRTGIREISAGELEMRNDEEAIQEYIDVVFGWHRDPERRLRGGENGTEVLARYAEGVAEAEAEAPEGAVVFVSHGAVIRVWAAARADNIDGDFAATHWLSNTAMVVMEGSSATGWTVTNWLEEPLGGPEVMDREHTGPAGEPEHEMGD